MNKKIFEFSYNELSLLVTQFHKDQSIITNLQERFLIYEAIHRQLHKYDPMTMKWVEHTLKMSFPKVYSIVNGLVKRGYLIREPSPTDQRIKFLVPTSKSMEGVKLFENMKLNELKFLGITKESIKGIPRISEFNAATKKRIQKDYLPIDWD